MTVTPEFGFPLPSDQSRIVKFPSHLRTLSTTLEEKLPGALSSTARAIYPGEVSRQIEPVRTELTGLATDAQRSAARAADALEDHEPRIQGLEAMAGLSPEGVTDGQTANLISQPDTSTRAALNAATEQQVIRSLANSPDLTDAAIAAAAVALQDAGVVTWVPGKNLYDYTRDLVGFYLNTVNGVPSFEFAGYRTSDYIKVTAGQPYTVNYLRHYCFYDGDRVFLSGEGLTQGTHTITPAQDGYLRFSYTHYPGTGSEFSPSTVQAEQGTAPTAVEPFVRVLSGVVIDTEPVVDDSPLTANFMGNTLTVTADHAGKPLAQTFEIESRENGVLNVRDTKLDGATVHAMNDEPAPLRTQHGTIGANHGFAQLYVWPATAHDKTTADLGSVWSDGSREYVLLGIDPSGRAFFGGDYTIHSSGMSIMPIADPAGDLTHVSGATNTSALPAAQKLARGAAQLWPAVQRVRTAVFVDGKPLTSGTAAGQQVEVRESYEVLEYSSVYETAKAHPGTSYADHRVDGCVRVESVYRIGSGGVASVDVSLTEITPTQLYATGLVQAVALSGSPTRYLPGVKAKGGYDWSAGVDLSTYSVTQLITTADLHSPTAPPVMSVDVRPDIAFVLGIHPWKPGPSHARDRLTEAPTNLWDLRSTKKSYPSVIVSEAPGWGRYEGHAVRAYLTPEQAAQVVSAGPDALGAWAALETVAQLP